MGWSGDYMVAYHELYTLGAFKSNMAAHFGHARIPQKNSAFLHDLETCHELESTQISFGELHSYAKLFYYFRVAR